MLLSQAGWLFQHGGVYAWVSLTAAVPACIVQHPVVVFLVQEVLVLSRSRALQKCSRGDEITFVQAVTQVAAVVRLLCQDLSQEIRAAVCRSACVPLAAAVGPARCASLLLPELIELIQVCACPRA